MTFLSGKSYTILSLIIFITILKHNYHSLIAYYTLLLSLNLIYQNRTWALNQIQIIPMDLKAGVRLVLSSYYGWNGHDDREVSEKWHIRTKKIIPIKRTWTEKECLAMR